MIEIRSSWVVVDGYVWPADALPKLPPGQGPALNRSRAKLSDARTEIRRRIAEKARR